MAEMIMITVDTTKLFKEIKAKARENIMTVKEYMAVNGIVESTIYRGKYRTTNRDHALLSANIVNRYVKMLGTDSFIIKNQNENTSDN